MDCTSSPCCTCGRSRSVGPRSPALCCVRFVISWGHFGKEARSAPVGCWLPSPFCQASPVTRVFLFQKGCDSVWPVLKFSIGQFPKLSTIFSYFFDSAGYICAIFTPDRLITSSRLTVLFSGLDRTLCACTRLYAGKQNRPSVPVTVLCKVPS